ncbi:MAG: type III secretion system export apparatus subunit SctU [Chthoniobacterales bacterium]
MSDQPSGEKTEQPTSKRLRDARNKGQVVRSTDIVTTVCTFFVMGVLSIMLPGIWKDLVKFYDVIFAAIAAPMPASVMDSVELINPYLISFIFPISIVAAIAVVIANVGQFGFLLAFESLKLDISKLSPMSGIKKIFSMKTLVELTKSIIKIIIFSVLLYDVVKKSIGPLVTLPFASLFNGMTVVQPMFKSFITTFMLCYVAIAVLDYLIQRRILTNELMMTKDEIKREMHESEGDPMIKGNRRRLQREMIFEDTATATRKSTVLVTNPTHYAAAIYYERGKTSLPVLRAKGTGFIALRMISVARHENIPIVENIPLARALYNQLEVNDIIPQDLLEPVTEILRWVRTLPPRVAE